jgi:hypothetical protein
VRGGRVSRLAVLALAGAISGACVSGSRLTEEAIRRGGNARATVTGTVRDESGRPVAGVGVIGLPRDRDLAWSPPAVSDGDGRFRLELIAPGNYAFLLSWQGVSVITTAPEDPSRVRIHVDPAEKRAVELTFPRAAWERTLAESGQTLPPP